MIQKLLILSTSHITKGTADYLEHGLDLNLASPRVNGGQTAFGFFLYCEAEPDPDQYPADLIAVFAHARSLGAEYVYLDRDGNELDALPKHEW